MVSINVSLCQIKPSIIKASTPSGQRIKQLLREYVCGEPIDLDDAVIFCQSNGSKNKLGISVFQSGQHC